MGKRLMAIILLLAVMALYASAGNAAEPPRVPRIMLAGDSWSHFLWFDRAYDIVLRERGFGQFVEDSIAVGGSKASQWASPGKIETTRDALLRNPTIDIVAMTIGGNDVLYGEKDINGDGNEETFSWFEHPGATDEEFTQWVVANVRTTVLGMLAVRPDLRVAILSYDYMNAIKKTVSGSETVCTLTPEQEVERCNLINSYMIYVEKAIAQNLKDIPRCRFINDYGVMQHYLGYPGDVIPAWVSPWTGECKWDTRWSPTTTDAFRFGPGVVPLPGQLEQNYQPFEGGDPSYKKSPWCSMLYYEGQWDAQLGIPLPANQPYDDWIHLSALGHHYLIQHAFNICLEDWVENPLGAPKVYQSVCLDDDVSLANTLRFRVMFSKPVMGVDAEDFDLAGPAGNRAKVVSVDPVSGTTKGAYATQYIVTVKLAANRPGNIVVNVLDDDSIVDETATPLGGAGEGNGTYISTGSFTVSAQSAVPVVAWPVAISMLLAGVGVISRRKK